MKQQDKFQAGIIIAGPRNPAVEKYVKENLQSIVGLMNAVLGLLPDNLRPEIVVYQDED